MLHYLGPLNKLCPYCHWDAEAVSEDEYVNCCHHGKVVLPFVVWLLPLLYDLYNDDSSCAKKFQQLIQQYNKVFAFTSTGGSQMQRPLC
jgi:hypothetical protein